ncbi:hypothetical protein EST38_g10185 [Candolleomyces aberdarensis]|uniref:Uncharacterized protein n=1 Tax=Candolleomyces aberdarensis TaxID=2316362 RepID=A0A4Q2D817_9AGAR|nr:hypothetical protein EST38_g10185 [Candolleomyces aberdarensis]
MSSKPLPKIVIKARPNTQPGPSSRRGRPRLVKVERDSEDDVQDEPDDVQESMDVDQPEEQTPAASEVDEEPEEDEDEPQVVVPLSREDGDDGADDEGEFGDDEYYGKPSRKIQGQTYFIEGDEFVTEDDPKGDEKIDKNGNLLGGRKFKASTFILPNRHPERQYMLAIDAARTSGFRDSLYYFRRNLLALKLNATQPEKDYLIAEGKLGSHLRTRSVTLITARSAYKLHGSKMIIDGRWVTDDYSEEKALAEVTEKGLKAGELVGELPDPAQTHQNAELSALGAGGGLGGLGGKGDRSGGGSGGLYKAGGPTTIFGGSGWGPFSDGPLNAVRKSLLSRDSVTEENWMWMMAARVREADEEWTKWRQGARKVPEGTEALQVTMANHPVPSDASKPGSTSTTHPLRDTIGAEQGNKRVIGFETEEEAATSSYPLGAYEPHTHFVHYRSDTQPTSARWVPVPDSPYKRRILGGTKVGNGAWALAWVDTVMESSAEAEGERVGEERNRLLREASADPIVLEPPLI